MAREDWESLFRCAPSGSPNCFEAEAFDGMELFDEDSEAPILNIFQLLQISPQRFLDMLNSPRDSTEHLITSKEREFRQSSPDTEFFTKESVFEGSEITVHEEDFKTWLDVGNYRLLRAWTINERVVEELRQMQDEQGWEEDTSRNGVEATPAVDGVSCKTPFLPCDKAGQEKGTELSGKELAEIKAALARERAENEKLRAEIAELKNAAEKGAEGEDWLDEYPICREIRDLHNKGMPREEIRLELTTTNRIASNVEIGFLTKKDTNFQSKTALIQSVHRDKRKVSPVTK